MVYHCIENCLRWNKVKNTKWSKKDFNIYDKNCFIKTILC